MTLTPSEKNITKSSKIYKARKLDNPEEIFGNHDPFQPQCPEVKELTVSTVSI